ncbi:MAG: DNA internalization-related competence protein ComEC/Rec2 [Chloroflexi bacterium]|nr:DNA internalization-related competence protein ComEC/Rec2 [Chloroflexota bacterium]
MILAGLALAFLAGVAAALHLPPGSSLNGTILALGTCAVVCALLLVPKRLLTMVAAVLGLFVLGIVRASDADTAATRVPDAVQRERQIIFEGELTAPPRPYGELLLLTIRADKILSNETPAILPGVTDEESGQQAPVSSPKFSVLAVDLAGASDAGRAPAEFRPGDRYRVSGRLTPVAAIAGAASDSVAVVRAGKISLIEPAPGGTFRHVLEQTRSSVGRAIERSAPEPAAGLMRAMITGERSGMGPALREAFRRSGTTHVLAISGMNIAIVAAGAVVIAAWAVGRRHQLYLILPAMAVWIYAGLAGFLPPVTRAAVMATVYLAGKAMGKQRSIAPSLALAAAVMVAIDPNALADVSFQLSFLAVLGIALIYPRMEAALETWLAGAPGPERTDWMASIALAVSKGVALSLAAISLTAPVILLQFGAISIWGAPATLLQLPVLSVLIVSSMAAGLAGWAWEPLGQLVAWPGWLASEYVIGTARFFASLPGGLADSDATLLLFAVAYYGTVIALLSGRTIGWLGSFRARLFKRMPVGTAQIAARSLSRALSSRLLIACLLLVAAVMWIGALSLPDGQLRVTFFETSGGDSILVRTPDGRQLLIDGGDSTLGAVRALGSRMPFWDRSLDMVVLSHPHADHARGLLAVLDRYRVDAILDAPATYESDVYQEWLSRSGAEPDCDRILAAPGTVITLDGGVFLEVLAPPVGIEAEDPNDRSVVLLLSYGDRAFLFTGDSSALAERWMLDSGANVRADVLKVAHQGSQTSSSDAFLAAVSPTIAIVPASLGNKYGHPHAEAMARIHQVVDPERVFITMRDGTVDVETDGRKLTVRSAR